MGPERLQSRHGATGTRTAPPERRVSPERSRCNPAEIPHVKLPPDPYGACAWTDRSSTRNRPIARVVIWVDATGLLPVAAVNAVATYCVAVCDWVLSLVSAWADF